MSCPRCPCPDCERARSPLPTPWKVGEPAPLPWRPLDRAQPYQLPEPLEECAIQRYFRDHPEETSVMMVCYCPRCTIRC